MSQMPPATPKLFEPSSIASQIDRALAGWDKSEHVSLMVSADLTRASMALLFRAGAHAELVVRISKPYSGSLEADFNARVHFAMGEVPPDTAPVPADAPLLLRDYTLIFLLGGNGLWTSVVKAIKVKFGLTVPFMPAEAVL